MTSIQLFIFACFCINAALSLVFSIQFIREKKPQSSLSPLILVILLSSTVWSTGMGMMSVQNDISSANYWRIFGIFGTFVFMISVQLTISHLANISRYLKLCANMISLLGIPIFLLYAHPGQTIYIFSDIGTTFCFKDNWITVIYALYYTVVSFNIFATTIYLAFKDARKQRRVAGRSFILIELCIFFGAIFDMVFPALGNPAFPGSAITHFWGVFIFWFTLHRMYKSEITVSNMSEYIYNSLNIPILVFDSFLRLKIINNAALSFQNITGGAINAHNMTINRLYMLDETVFNFKEDNANIKTETRDTLTECELHISKIYDPYHETIGYIIMVNDLTERNRVISELERAKLAADAANTSKSVFLANMSHEIRTPMNAIIGFSDVALMEDHDKEAMEYFTSIKRAGETLLTLINQVLEISKIELGTNTLKEQDYRPSDMLRDVELIISMQARKKGLSFIIDAENSLPAVLHGDKDKVRQVLINLLSNSVKYSNSGTVTLECHSSSNDGQHANLTFIVSDNGIGISKEDLPHIFENFKRVDSVTNSTIEGTGLGLSITKGLIELMQGTVTVESTLGIGSKFTVTIPQLITEAESEPLSDVPETESPKKTTLNLENNRVLIVDDNVVNLRLALSLLKKYNLKCDAATGGKQALEMCKRKSYNLIFLDQMMPEMDGIETLRRLRILPEESNGKTKAVALTANFGEGVEDELLKAGFDAYLSKPINIELLESILQKFL